MADPQWVDDRRRRPHWPTLALVLALHCAALAGLVRAFAPDLASSAIERAGQLVTVAFEDPPPPAPPPPPPVPQPQPSAAPEPVPQEGEAAPEAPRATPRAVVAPTPAVVIPRVTPPAPPVAATGTENRAGAGESGEGSGAGGAGQGTGSGRSGSGQGGGAGGIAATQPVKIGGTISDARDYPVPPGGRAIRQGRHVIIHMLVGTDGRARECRVVEPSPDPEADRLTCRLAQERFRFRPARDAAGNPVPALFGWRQDWF